MLAVPQPQPDPLRDALREWAAAQAGLADAIDRYLGSQESRPRDRPRLQAVR